jgi:hypothetical protein
MKKNFYNWGRSEGSALLITLLMLGIMMTLTLGISTLVIREIQVTQSIVDANKAYYAAEAGVERALFGVSKNLAGFEPKGEYPGEGVALDAVLAEFDPTFAYSFDTSNKSDSVPSFSDDKPIFIEKAAYTDAGGETIADCVLSNARSPFAFAFTKEKVYQDCARATYRKLGLNETHIIPLYSTDETGQPV